MNKPDHNADGYHAQLSANLEAVVDRLYELTPILHQHFNGYSDAFKERLDQFNEKTPPPYHSQHMERDEVKQAFDHSATALAQISRFLYRHIDEHCSLEHYELLRHIKSIADEFNQRCAPKLEILDLKYHEFSSLALLAESKLGLDSESLETEKLDRRRRMKKDPAKIESALRECVDIAESLRGKILNPKREAKLDKIIEKVQGILADLPLDDSEEINSKRTNQLIRGTAEILKVEKWVRKVDLLANERSQRTKDEILGKFGILEALAQGRERCPSR